METQAIRPKRDDNVVGLDMRPFAQRHVWHSAIILDRGRATP